MQLAVHQENGPLNHLFYKIHNLLNIFQKLTFRQMTFFPQKSVWLAKKSPWIGLEPYRAILLLTLLNPTFGPNPEELIIRAYHLRPYGLALKSFCNLTNDYFGKKDYSTSQCR